MSNTVAQLLLHLWGDYIYGQNDWMATNKKNKGFTGFLACLIHCILYSLPFLLIASWQAVFVIFITHFLIDRTSFVTYLIALKNFRVKKWKIDKGVCGFDPARPFAVAIWLNIIVDNIIHITINYFAILFL
jgi:hypothetical protein